MTIQSKLNYLIVHESPEFKTNLVDKIMLHNYSIKKLGKDICVPIIKIYNDTKEIKLDELPDKFALKYNHGSGMNILCNNKWSIIKIKTNKIIFFYIIIIYIIIFYIIIIYIL